MGMARHPQASALAAAPWRTALAGALIGIVLGTAAFAPASWLAAAISSASGEQVKLTNPRGSIWQGSSQLALSGGVGSEQAVALPGQIHWKVRPDWAGVRMQVSADCCTPQPLQLQAATLGFRGLKLVLGDGQSQWPAGLLAGLGTPWNTVQPQGELALATQGLAAEWLAGRLALSGGAELTARRLSSRLSTLRPLGSYRLRLRGGDAVGLELSTLEGGLLLSGSGQWVGARLRFRGEARAAPGLEAPLANLLNIIGRRQGARSLLNIG